MVGIKESRIIEAKTTDVRIMENRIRVQIIEVKRIDTKVLKAVEIIANLNHIHMCENFV